MTNDTCSNCGASLSDGSPIYVISERDVPGLVSLFKCEFDEERCEACRHPVGIRPTVTVLLSEPIETLLAFGSQVDAAEREDCLADLQGAEVVPAEVASLDDLRNGIAARLKTRIDPLTRIIHERFRRPNRERAIRFVRDVPRRGACGSSSSAPSPFLRP